MRVDDYFDTNVVVSHCILRNLSFPKVIPHNLYGIIRKITVKVTNIRWDSIVSLSSHAIFEVYTC
jgi:hypothetical protein